MNLLRIEGPGEIHYINPINIVDVYNKRIHVMNESRPDYDENRILLSTGKEIIINSSAEEIKQILKQFPK